jgi:hypothetical protein
MGQEVEALEVPSNCIGRCHLLLAQGLALWWSAQGRVPILVRMTSVNQMIQICII